MNKTATPLIFAGIAAAAYVFYRNFKGFSQTYRITVGRIKFNSRATQANAFLRAIFDINLNITNPTNFTGNVQAVKLNVILNDKILGSINQTVKINIPAQNTVIIPVQVGVSTLNIYDNISNAIKALSNQEPLNFQIIGTVITNYGTVNINEIATVNF